jgi:lipopolysaccharide export system protein LptA
MTRGRPRGWERRWLALGGACALLMAFALASPNAQAQAPAGGFGGLNSADSKQPIDIESDQLEVDDKKHMAVFSGNVSATQGTNNLTAQRLEVFYENASQQGAKAGHGPQADSPVKAASASADPVSGGQIKRIHATGGKVVVKSTKDQQEVTGDDAMFDVKAQLITMTGKEVTLLQGLSTVKGTKLVIDLNTGKANLINSDSAGGGPVPASKPRISATFQQQTGADGKMINPLTSLGVDPSKQQPSAEPKKKPDPKKNTASQPVKKTPAPSKPNAAPASEWFPENH